MSQLSASNLSTHVVTDDTLQKARDPTNSATDVNHVIMAPKSDNARYYDCSLAVGKMMKKQDMTVAGILAAVDAVDNQKALVTMYDKIKVLPGFVSNGPNTVNFEVRDAAVFIFNTFFDEDQAGSDAYCQQRLGEIAQARGYKLRRRNDSFVWVDLVRVVGDLDVKTATKFITNKFTSIDAPYKIAKSLLGSTKFAGESHRTIVWSYFLRYCLKPFKHNDVVRAIEDKNDTYKIYVRTGNLEAGREATRNANDLLQRSIIDPELGAAILANAPGAGSAALLDTSTELDVYHRELAMVEKKTILAREETALAEATSRTERVRLEEQASRQAEASARTAEASARSSEEIRKQTEAIEATRQAVQTTKQAVETTKQSVQETKRLTAEKRAETASERETQLTLRATTRQRTKEIGAGIRNQQAASSAESRAEVSDRAPIPPTGAKCLYCNRTFKKGVSQLHMTTGKCGKRYAEAKVNPATDSLFEGPTHEEDKEWHQTTEHGCGPVMPPFELDPLSSVFSDLSDFSD